MKKKDIKIKKILIIVVGIGLIISLSRSVLRLLKLGSPAEKLKEELLALELEREDLLNKRDYYQSDKFIEDQARNTLNMGKPGETIVVLPDSLSKNETSQSMKNTPNWKKWIEVFFPK